MFCDGVSLCSTEYEAGTVAVLAAVPGLETDYPPCATQHITQQTGHSPLFFFSWYVMSSVRSLCHGDPKPSVTYHSTNTHPFHSLQGYLQLVFSCLQQVKCDKLSPPAYQAAPNSSYSVSLAEC